MTVQWGLGGNMPDIGAQFQAGYERGQQQRRERELDRALRGISSNPNDPIARTTAMRLDPTRAGAIINFQREEARRRAIQAATRPDGNVDDNAVVAALTQAGDVEGAQEYRGRSQQQRLQQLQLFQHVNEQGLRLLASVRDQATWTQARQQAMALAQQFGLPDPGLPEQFDPAVVERLRMQGLTVAQQLEQETQGSYTLGGHTRYDRNNRVVASVPNYIATPPGGRLVLEPGSGQPVAGQQAPAPAPAPTMTAPPVGTIEDGHRFRGGNPADPNNWEPVGGASPSGSQTFPESEHWWPRPE